MFWRSFCYTEKNRETLSFFLSLSHVWLFLFANERVSNSSRISKATGIDVVQKSGSGGPPGSLGSDNVRYSLLSSRQQSCAINFNATWKPAETTGNFALATKHQEDKLTFVFPVVVFALHRNSLHKAITIPQQWLCVCVSGASNVRFWVFPLPNTGYLCQGEYWLCCYFGV